MKYPSSEYAKYLISLQGLPESEQKTDVKKFAQLLEKNGDIKDWKKIVEVYESIRDKESKIKKAKISYFGEIHKEKIKEAVKSYDVEFEEDKNLLGGIRIQIGDVRIDNTIAGRLGEARKVLK